MTKFHKYTKKTSTLSVRKGKGRSCHVMGSLVSGDCKVSDKSFYLCSGGMAEWSIAAVLKTVVPSREPGVRIPLPPQAQSKPFRRQAGGFFLSGRRRARTSGGLKGKTAVRSTRFALGFSLHLRDQRS